MSESQSLVSVVIPVYNGGKTIDAAIASILSGSHADVEVLVCDDASTDDTVNRVRSIGDSRITLLSNTNNLGPGLSRDKAIDACRGRWLTFLDADDTWAPWRLARMLDAIGDDKDVMVFDDIMLCHQNSAGMQLWRRVYGKHAFGSRGGESLDLEPARWAASSQFVMQPLLPMAALRASGVRHSARRFQEDTEFFLRLVVAGFKLRYTPHAGYLYRITPGSLSSTSSPGMLTRQMLEELLPLFADDADMQRVLERKISYRHFTQAIRSGDIQLATALAIRDKRLVAELARRTSGLIRYHAHRLAHGAARR